MPTVLVVALIILGFTTGALVGMVTIDVLDRRTLARIEREGRMTTTELADGRVMFVLKPRSPKQHYGSGAVNYQS